MGKKYVMFVDERGVRSLDKSENLLMIGVIFEYDYCTDSKNGECELKRKLNEYKKESFGNIHSNIPIDNIILKEKVYKNINNVMINEFVYGLPILFKKLRFKIISSTVKQNLDKTNDSYFMATQRLLRKFNSFTTKNNGESGGIVIEAKEGNVNYKILQNFFDIYNNRNTNSSMLDNFQNKINTFIVSEKSNKIYGSGIEVLNIINNVFFRVLNGKREIDDELILYTDYGNRDRIFSELKHKIYNDIGMGISSDQLQAISQSYVEGFSKELKLLKEQLKLKDARIKEKEKEISQLTNEIKVLAKQLERVLVNRKNDNIVSRILSDIDVTVSGFDKVITVSKN